MTGGLETVRPFFMVISPRKAWNSAKGKFIHVRKQRCLVSQPKYRMFTRVGNLIFASLAFFIVAMSEAGFGSRTPRQQLPARISMWGIIAGLITLYWFAGALGLFWRKRFAWFGSLVGTGAASGFFAAVLLGMVWIYIFPDAEMERLQSIEGQGSIAAFMIGVTEFTVLLGISLCIFVGLIRIRKELR